MIRTLEIFRQNLDPNYERKLEESIGRWHWKVLHAQALEKDFRGMVSYGTDLLLGRGGSRAAFLKASSWALQNKSG